MRSPALRTMLRRLHRFLAAGPRAWRDLFRAQIALLAAARRVRTKPVGALTLREAVPPEGMTGDARRVEELALALGNAARHGVMRPECLVRSLALRDLLVREGVRGASIRVGVRREQGRFQAHAWVTWRGRVLADDPRHVAAFVEVEDLSVLDPR